MSPRSFFKNKIKNYIGFKVHDEGYGFDVLNVSVGTKCFDPLRPFRVSGGFLLSAFTFMSQVMPVSASDDSNNNLLTFIDDQGSKYLLSLLQITSKTKNLTDQCTEAVITPLQYTHKELLKESCFTMVNTGDSSQIMSFAELYALDHTKPSDNFVKCIMNFVAHNCPDDKQDFSDISNFIKNNIQWIIFAVAILKMAHHLCHGYREESQDLSRMFVRNPRLEEHRHNLVEDLEAQTSAVNDRSYIPPSWTR